MSTRQPVPAVLLAIAVIAAGAAAPVTAGIAGAADDGEPNDDFETATPITEGNVSAETVAGESDFYRIEANTTDAVDIVVTPESGPVVVTLYDGDRERLARDRNRLRRTGTVRITRRAPETGSYYVEVRGKDTRTGPTTTAYQLESNRTGTLPVRTPPPVVGDRAPRDPDANGAFEDVNGDGDVTPGDATVLFDEIFTG